jgi:putative solute:sodium symporter small subunit
VVGFGLAIFGAPFLNRYALGGVPLGFWMAQQGAIFVFVALVWAFAWTSDRADRAAGVDETDDLPVGPGH